MSDFIITIVCASLSGYLLAKLKIPGGMMVGAILGTVALNLALEKAYIPEFFKLTAQIISGAFIGIGITREDIKRLRQIFIPFGIVTSFLLVFNILMGFILYSITDMDLLTAFFCAVPGGMTDTPLIAAEMGADSGTVALMQFFRLCAGIGIFPTIITKITKKEDIAKSESNLKKNFTKYNHKGFVVVAIIAPIGGIVGILLGIPAGALIFSLIFTVITKQIYVKATLPKFVRKCAQVLAGSYIGTSMDTESILGMGNLIIPGIVLVVGYFLGCVVISKLLKKYGGLTTREGMLASTPAGAADIALISADLGIESPDVTVLQIGRLLAVILIFPQVIFAIASIFM